MEHLPGCATTRDPGGAVCECGPIADKRRRLHSVANGQCAVDAGFDSDVCCYAGCRCWIGGFTAEAEGPR